jgi:hypothetical protein
MKLTNNILDENKSNKDRIISVRRWDHYKSRKNKEKLSSKENFKYTIGLIIFLFIFVLIIPYILYRFNLITILLVYFLNIDLLATMVGSIETPIHDYFRYLYSDSTPLIGYLSQTIITLIVLGAVFLIVASRTRSSNLGVALIRYLFTILITFLAPNRFISQIMHNTYIFLKDKQLFNNLAPYLATIPAFLLIYLIILFEAFCLEYFSKPLGNYFNKYIMNLSFIDHIEKYRK